MNRYVVEGIARDVAAGRRVAVLSDRPGESWHLLLDAFPMGGVEKVIRSNGAEAITHESGGRVIVRRKASNSLRGHELDVIFAEPGGLTPEQLEEHSPALSSRGGALIRS